MVTWAKELGMGSLGSLVLWRGMYATYQIPSWFKRGQRMKTMQCTSSDEVFNNFKICRQGDTMGSLLITTDKVLYVQPASLKVFVLLDNKNLLYNVYAETFSKTLQESKEILQMQLMDCLLHMILSDMQKMALLHRSKSNGHKCSLSLLEIGTSPISESFHRSSNNILQKWIEQNNIRQDWLPLLQNLAQTHDSLFFFQNDPPPTNNTESLAKTDMDWSINSTHINSHFQVYFHASRISSRTRNLAVVGGTWKHVGNLSYRVIAAS